MINKVLNAVSTVFDVPIDELKSNSHKIKVVKARSCAIKWLRYSGQLVNPEIAELLNVTNNTVKNGLFTYDSLFASNRIFQRQVIDVVKLIEE